METYLIHTKKAQLKVIKPLLKALKVNIEKIEKPYNPEFVKKIDISIQQVKEGKTTKITLNDIWKNSLSEKEMEESGKRLLDSKQPVLKLSQVLEIEKERQAVEI